MIVGTANINIDELLKHVLDEQELIDYIDSLIPPLFREVEKIRMNQRYLCAMQIRNSLAIEWGKKKEVAEFLESDIEVTGYTDSLLEIEAIYDGCNHEKLNEYMSNMEEENQCYPLMKLTLK